ncbi:MAG: hypothetical protein AB7W16_01190 [Candidatus Obscuribacterales bacterium]
MKQVLTVIALVIQVLILAFAIDNIFPMFSDLTLKEGFGNAALLAVVFVVVRNLINRGRDLLLRGIPGLAGKALLFLVTFLLMPMVTLLIIAAVAPAFLTIGSYLTAFAAGLVTMAAGAVTGILVMTLVGSLAIARKN